MSEIITEEIPDSLAGERLDRIVSLMAEISRADATTTIAAGAVELDGVVGAEHIIRIPVASPLFQPVLATIPLQVFAYEIAVARGTDVDQPRNLAKSVTVE